MPVQQLKEFRQAYLPVNSTRLAIRLPLGKLFSFVVPVSALCRLGQFINLSKKIFIFDRSKTNRMKKILSIAMISLGLVQGAQAQTGNQGYHCKSVPVASGTITEQESKPELYSANSLVITAQSDKVTSLSTGAVSSVFGASNGTKVVIVCYRTDSFFAYSGLSEVEVAKGQKVQRGQIIARAATNDAGQKEFALQVWKAKNTSSDQMHLTNKEALDIIKKADF